MLMSKLFLGKTGLLNLAILTEPMVNAAKILIDMRAEGGIFESNNSMFPLVGKQRSTLSVVEVLKRLYKVGFKFLKLRMIYNLIIPVRECPAE